MTITKRGGIRFIRLGRLRISVCVLLLLIMVTTTPFHKMLMAMRALRIPKLIASLQEQGAVVDVQNSATYTAGFRREMALTETMMQRARLEPM